jgi:hypothetical protein
LPNQPKQRFLALNVNEISVVDTPANEVEFLVMKRLEESSMETTDATVTETEKNTPTPELVEVEAATASENDAAVNKALEQVASMVENIAKASGVKIGGEGETGETGDPGEAEPTTTTTKAEGEGETEPAEEDAAKAKKTFDPRAMFGKQLKAAGVTGDAFTKAMANFDKAFKPFQPGASTQPPVQKDATGGEETPDAEEQAIQKAKRFTPAREAQFKSALETLTKLLSDMQQIPTGGSPSTTTPSGTSFGASGVATLTKAIETLTETVTKSNEDSAKLAERVEAIEKARNPSQSLEADGETDTPTKKSFWAGVL